jgi:hypothetical protein
LTPQNIELGKRPKQCDQIFTWEGWYFARKHNVKISSEIKTQLILLHTNPRTARVAKMWKNITISIKKINMATVVQILQPFA